MAEIYAWDTATDWSWSTLSVQLVPFQIHVQKSGFPPFFTRGFFRTSSDAPPSWFIWKDNEPLADQNN